ncbi:MAG: LysR family transcriptional regulator [Gammaproteobacteria bacterium]|nr:LysR family transcriptional regulator [Gammaproteobacteria bacterium]
MDLNQLVIFAKVAENQSFTKAAKILGIEKSTVSNKISLLEKRLGVRLLNRNTRLVSVTEAGDAYYQHCRQVVDAANEAELFAKALNNNPQGVLRISAPQDFSQLLVQQLIEPFIRQYREVKIDLAVLDREVDLIAERFDIALRIGKGSLKDSNLVGKKLFDVPMGLYAAPHWLKQQGEASVNKNPLDYPFIIFSKQLQGKFVFGEGIVPEEFQVKAQLKINDMLTCKEAAANGLGIALLPNIIADGEVKLNRLKQIALQFPLPSMALFAVYPSRQWMPAKLKMFLKYLDDWENYHALI